jgi:hypothetical protein
MKIGKFIIKTAILMLTFTAVFAFAGCDEEEPVCGGTTDKTDHDAPKVIESKDITSFYARFCLVGEWTPGRENLTYTFEIKDVDGVLTAAEHETGVRSPADKELLDTLQGIIDDEKLVAKNGVYRVTAGLPPEYQKCNVTVNYASGERLTFTENNDPYAEWAKKTYLAFAYWFSGKGDDSLIPPGRTEKISDISVDFTENGERTLFTSLNV